MTTVIVSLEVFDDQGGVVDTCTAVLDDNQVSDVVAQAVQVVYAMRRAVAIGGDLDLQTVAELEESLLVYGLIEDDDYFPA